MHSIPTPTRQPYTGSLTDQDPISSRLPLIGQLNPTIGARWALSQGRSVAGFGMAPESYQAERKDDYVEQIEGDDDVMGSGIFDAAGRMPTVHPQLGVFADHPSLPGYIAREVLFAVSREIVDISNGADVVAIPTGGMAYVERGGRNVGPLVVDDHNNPYVLLQPGQMAKGSPRQMIPAGKFRDAPPPGAPLPKGYPDGGTASQPYSPPQDVPEQPYNQAFSPTDPQYGTAFQQSIPATDTPAPTGPGTPAPATSGYGWFGGFGAELPAAPAPAPSTPGVGSFVVAGAVLGVAAAIFVSTVNPPKKKGRGRR